jgi:DNA (cytosine-5)-methyltransferase 1
MSRLRLLDLFCGGGGASAGYAQAGFDVTGVDIAPQKNYPFDFIQADAIEYVTRYGHLFDFIHASPPCQRYSVTMPMQTREHPDLVPATRAALIATGRPYVIENVVGAPLIEPVMLCGQMFGLPLYRHRLFECSFFLLAPPHARHTVRSGGCNGTSVERANAAIMCLVGNFPGVKRARTVMQTPWMTRGEIAQAIPPAYTEFIGRAFLASAVAA